MRGRTGILVALVAAIAAVLRWWSNKPPDDDEERPAMIVKNGSLVFQSGDDDRGEKGKPWKELGTGRWTPHQPKGKSANRMILTVLDGEDDCSRAPVRVKDITVRYFGSRGVETFHVRREGDRHKIPVVVGDGLSEDNRSQNPTLERPGPPGNFTLVYTPESGPEKGCNVSKVAIQFER